MPILSMRSRMPPAEHLERLRTSPDGMHEDEPSSYTTRQKIGLWLGPILFIAMLLLPTPAGMEPSAQKMAAVGLVDGDLVDV